MKDRSITPHGALRVLCSSALVAGALLLGGAVQAQTAADVNKLKLQLEKQKLALQEAIADREATAARVDEIKAMLVDSKETKSQIEEEVKMLCEEKEELQAGSFDECMDSSGN